MIFARDGSSATGMESVPTKARRKPAYKWVDSMGRFCVQVSKQQNGPPFLKIDINAISPQRASKKGPQQVADTVSGVVDDLYLMQQETVELIRVELHPLKKEDRAEPVHVLVCIEQFWSSKESGGNRGRPVRRGFAYISGSSQVMQVLQVL
jgi:hypothetical protein